MAKAIEVLMNEHRLIERVLGSLETFAIGVEGGLAPERPFVADYAAFFRGFADACHHGKEEDILFQRMIERGFPRETGLLLENATGFIPLLRAHILKEDRILYPMAERLLTGPEMDAMETEFEAFERTMRADGSYDRLTGLAEKLLAAFRPDPGRMAEAAQMVGCGAGR